MDKVVRLYKKLYKLFRMITVTIYFKVIKIDEKSSFLDNYIFISNR